MSNVEERTAQPVQAVLESAKVNGTALDGQAELLIDRSLAQHGQVESGFQDSV